METSAPPHVSVVIPAYNEERLLPRLLDSLDTARAAYSRGPQAVEVVVADNASTDDTAGAARARGCRVVTVEKRSIAAARNGGARAAAGEVLAFVDADFQVHRRTFDTIDAALAAGRVVGGATGVTMERWSAGIALTYALFMPMVWLMRMDTGVVFCRREDFEAVGGYDEKRLYAEDVKFLLALRRRGRPRGERLTRLRSVKAVASTRKFDRHGDWHYFKAMPKALLQELGLFGGREALADYWYKPQR